VPSSSADICRDSPGIPGFFATHNGVSGRMELLIISRLRAVWSVLAQTWNAVNYGNACGSNDGHGAAVGTALPCAHPSSCADTDANSSPTDASADHFALCTDCHDRRNACCANDGYDDAVYARWVHSCRTGDDFDGFHDNPDQRSSGCTNE
jgi:hypothetical protein